MENIHLIYFSPAYSTREIARIVGENINSSFIEHDITQGLDSLLSFTANEIVVFAMPVYAGRVPVQAVIQLNKIKGNNTPAFIVCVYGNRDYDDALLELQDISETNGFNVIGGAAFVARHSIFPTVAENRPDADDLKVIKEFADKCLMILNNPNSASKKIEIKGNRPYKIPGKIPFTPKANNKCNNCGTCAKLCPAGAIPINNLKSTDKSLCFTCTRCIYVCPQNARKIGGLVYKIANSKFRSAYADRKEPELFF